jgi:hypothetical protein
MPPELPEGYVAYPSRIVVVRLNFLSFRHY